MSSKNIEAIYPLSPQQQGVLFETLFASGHGIHIDQLVWTWHGDLDISAFKTAWQQVIERHSMLRTAFVWRERDEPLQVVLKHAVVPLQYEDWRTAAAGQKSEKLLQYAEEDWKRGFQLAEAPLLRFGVFQTDERQFEIVFTRHHILMDGWCLPIIHREFFLFYRAAVTGTAAEVTAPQAYKSYIAWLKRQDAAAAETFWRTTLAGVRRPTALGKETEFEDSAESGEHHQSCQVRLAAEETAGLRRLAQQHGLTVNTLLQGAWAAVLSRYSGENHVLYGTTVSGRPPELDGVESIIGLFTTTVPFRVRVAPGENLIPWLQQLQIQHMHVREYQSYSTGQIHGWSEVPGSVPLFESILVFENYPVEATTVQGLGLEVKNPRPVGARTKYALTLIGIERDELRLVLIFDSRRFGAAEAAKVLDHLQNVLRHILANPGQTVASLIQTVPAAEIPVVKVPKRRHSAEASDAPPRSSLEAILVRLWGELLGFQHVGIHENFFDLGGHSLLAVRLFARIEDLLGEKLAISTLLQAPTIAELADVLSNKATRQWAALVPIQANGSRPPLFCMHGAGGTVLFYRDLARHLGPDQPVYGLQARGVDGKEPPHTRIEDMAADYIREIRALQPAGPYLLSGSSFGGTIAYEMARQLVEAGEKVGLLALFDTYGPGYPQYMPGMTRFRRKLYRWRIRIELHARSLWIMPRGQILPYVTQKGRKAAHLTAQVLRNRIRRIFSALGQPLPKDLLKTQFTIREAIGSYVVRDYPATVTLFRATKQVPGIVPDPAMGWNRVALGKLQIHEVPAIHASMVQEPWVQGLVKILKPCLEQIHESGEGESTSMPQSSKVIEFAGGN